MQSNKLKIGRTTRLLGGLVLAGAMSICGCGVAKADSTAAGTNDNTNGFQHFMDCLGLLGNSAQHQQECGGDVNTVNNTNGISQPFNRTGSTCGGTGMLNSTYGLEVKTASLGGFGSDAAGTGPQLLLASRCCYSSLTGTPFGASFKTASLGGDTLDLGVPKAFPPETKFACCIGLNTAPLPFAVDVASLDDGINDLDLPKAVDGTVHLSAC